MAVGKSNVIREGARLLWRQQRVLWWLYGINLLLAVIGTLPMANNVRALLICMLIAIVPLLIIASVAKRWSDKLATDAPHAMMGFWVEVVGLLVVALLLMAVRVWFDMAQVRAVAENERAMGRTLVHALRLTLANFTTLFWIYLRISLIAWAFSAAAFWGWIKVVR